MANKYDSLIYKGSTGTNPYSTKVFDAYRKGQETKQAKEISTNTAERDKMLAAQNAQYDKNATQNYVNYQRAMKDVPSQLNALGIRGGASESSLLRLGTNYNTNVANNEQARAGALDELRNTYAKLADEINSRYATDIRDKQFEYEQKSRQWEYEQEQKDLEKFASAITGQFDNETDWKDYIAYLKKSSDPNKVAKVMLAQQAYNAWKKEQDKKSSSGGGGSRRSYSSGGYSSSSSSSSGGTGVSYQDTLNNAKVMSDAEKRNAAAQKQRTGRVQYGSGNTTTKKKNQLVYGNSFTGGLYYY